MVWTLPYTLDPEPRPWLQAPIGNTLGHAILIHHRFHVDERAARLEHREQSCVAHLAILAMSDREDETVEVRKPVEIAKVDPVLAACFFAVCQRVVDHWLDSEIAQLRDDVGNLAIAQVRDILFEREPEHADLCVLDR